MSFDLNVRSFRTKQGRRGLTLIELIVVLVILIGLGGLLVPVITNALTRTHVSTCAQNFSEISTAIMRLEVLRGDFGNFWDTGIESGTTNSVNAGMNVVALTDPEAAALAEAGITNVVDHQATGARTDDYNITFNPEYVPRAAALSAADSLITLDADAILDLNLDAGAKYVWLGIGPRWTGTRDVTFEPPVHFGDDPENLPNNTYSRFGSIFQVTDITGAALPKAQFRGVSYSFGDNEYEVSDEHIGIYWIEVNGQ
ncbi:MAG: prepilin-type N-terminal cleavage/methylation domain-containing protein [Planctomycetota bacterium]